MTSKLKKELNICSHSHNSWARKNFKISENLRNVEHLPHSHDSKPRELSEYLKILKKTKNFTDVHVDESRPQQTLRHWKS